MVGSFEQRCLQVEFVLSGSFFSRVSFFSLEKHLEDEGSA